MWEYGWGEYDPAAKMMKSFTPLPFFTGKAWQGGDSWPDKELGWVQLTADQQPFLQGYLPILSLCQQVVYGLAPINVDTGAGFVTPDNYKIVAELATEALR